MLRLRQSIRYALFNSDTLLGKVFDYGLLVAILLSIAIVMLESVEEIEVEIGGVLLAIEWVLTGLFTIEYLVRLWAAQRPLRYALSFYGIVDLLALLPTYLTLFITGGGYLMVIRALRLVRVFRILKLTRYSRESRVLIEALIASHAKITVFFSGVAITVLIMGSLMYMIEGGENGFTSIPRSVYWAIVTLTTVGYGDIAPKTVVGQAFAAFLMLLGYAIITVPTGIVTAELSHQPSSRRVNRQCASCGHARHEPEAHFCNRCGGQLPTHSFCKNQFGN